MTTPQLDQRLEFAVDIARDAGQLILRYYQAQDLSVDVKDDRSPVTVADRGAEELIRSRIQVSFPDDGILGEEFGEQPGSNGYRWILDPVDGTKSFVHGVPLFGTLIGLEFEDRVVLGVCRFPALDEVVYAANGGGAWWQIREQEPRPARVSTIDSLADALFCTTTITRWATVGRQSAFDRLSQTCRLTRGWGDCYGHMLVATGRADVMVDPALNTWDAAALLPIVQEAGGHFVDFDGLPSIHSGNGLSVNAGLKDEVLEVLRSTDAE
jgi:histidinol-phosphatase